MNFAFGHLLTTISNKQHAHLQFFFLAPDGMSLSFEYKVVPWLRQFALTDRDLNRHGADGWELVSTMPESDDSVLLIFKRAVSEIGDSLAVTGNEEGAECGEDSASGSELISQS